MSLLLFSDLWVWRSTFGAVEVGIGLTVFQSLTGHLSLSLFSLCLLLFFSPGMHELMLPNRDAWDRNGRHMAGAFVTKTWSTRFRAKPDTTQRHPET